MFEGLRRAPGSPPAWRAGAAARITIGYMGLIGVILLVFRRGLIGLFTEDAAVIQAGSWILIWAALFQGFDALAITYTNALRGVA